MNYLTRQSGSRGDLMSATPQTFDPRKQCHWCGSDNLDRTPGYAGERQCLTCGWGGDGQRDVPCMFYKLVTNTCNDRRHEQRNATD